MMSSDIVSRVVDRVRKVERARFGRWRARSKIALMYPDPTHIRYNLVEGYGYAIRIPLNLRCPGYGEPTGAEVIPI